MSKTSKTIRRAISGVLLLDKPAGLTSNAALQITKRLYNAAKVGHTGTLDPFATGLLPLCFGEATKFSQFLLDADKTYLAEVKLGVRTSSGDLDGDIMAERPVQLTGRDIEAALPAFRGEIEQVPPMHSALKHHGRPLYEYARQGIDIAREPRRVTVHNLTLDAFEGDRCTLRVHCSKGFYVRALADDLGEMLGCGAHLVGLRRLAVGRFTLTDAITPEQLEALDTEGRDTHLRPADALIDDLPSLALNADAAWQITHGQPLWLPRLEIGTLYRLYDPQNSFIGVAVVNTEGKLAPKRLIAA